MRIAADFLAVTTQKYLKMITDDDDEDDNNNDNDNSQQQRPTTTATDNNNINNMSSFNDLCPTGIVCLKNLKVRSWERILWYIALVILLLLTLVAVLVNTFYQGYPHDDRSLNEYYQQMFEAYGPKWTNGTIGTVLTLLAV